MGVAYNSRIITENLVLCLDAANSKSYPGSGTTWTDLSGNGNNATLTNGPTYSSANGGSIVFDGVILSNDGLFGEFLFFVLSIFIPSKGQVSGIIISSRVKLNGILFCFALLFALANILYPTDFDTAFGSNRFLFVSADLSIRRHPQDCILPDTMSCRLVLVVPHPQEHEVSHRTYFLQGD